MQEKSKKGIFAVNYWEHPPKLPGFNRQHYLAQLTQSLNNPLLKVLVGQRRSGKSYILKQFINYLFEKSIPATNVLYLNFELHELQFIQSVDTLLEVIRYYYTEIATQGKTYLLLDEIQEIPGWEKAVNSYLANERYDVEIFITGSNAHLLSTELSTYVTGRYVEIPIFPFSFIEYTQYKKQSQNRSSLIDYLQNSGIPEFFRLTDETLKFSYLSALKDSIVMNDIVKRFNIKNAKLLLLVLDFLIDNIGHLFSFNALVKKMKSNGININVTTASNYIHYLEMTYLIHGISRYDVRGKRILEGERKYYLNDLAFYNYFTSTFDDGINRKLENYVYQTLIQAGYQVYVGNLYQKEIDFVAEKQQAIIYIQVTYLLHSKTVIQREYGNLEKINDNWPKWVVSLDEVPFPSKQGIEHIPAWRLAEKLQ